MNIFPDDYYILADLIRWTTWPHLWFQWNLQSFISHSITTLSLRKVCYSHFSVLETMQVKWWAQPSLNWARCLQTVLSQNILTLDICQLNTSALIAHQSKEPYNWSVHLQIAEYPGQQENIKWISRSRLVVTILSGS